MRLLEGEQECYFKLFKPAVFKFGRKDCVPDQGKKVATYIFSTKEFLAVTRIFLQVTEFPYEATEPESHPNNYGGAKEVVDSLQVCI